MLEVINDDLPETVEEQAMRLDKVFHQKYRGGVVDEFLQALSKYESMYRDDTYHGKIISIQQSHGTGRSCLVEELGSHGEEITAAFYGALLEVVTDAMEPSPSPKEAMRAWQVELPAASRRQQFTKVARRAEKILADYETKLEDMISNSTERKTEVVFRQDLDTFFHLAQPRMQALATKLCALGYSRFIVAFDGCTALNRIYRGMLRAPIGRTSLDALGRVIKAADGCEHSHGIVFWHLFVNTEASVPPLAIQKEIPSNFGFLADLYIPLPVWVYLGFDQLREEAMERLEKPEDALILHNLKFFGRPLWKTCRMIDLLREATLRLFGIYNFNPNDQHHVFAAFASRVLLEVADNAAASPVAETAVARHMRMLMGVVRGGVSTKAPSEPLLAIAAAQELSQKGDLCGRLLMTLARDKATLPHGGRFVQTKGDRHLDAISAATFSQFLVTLLGDDLGLSKEEDQRSLGCWGSGVWLNFMHFVQIDTDIDKITPKYLRELWTRTCAAQCKVGHPVIDGFLVGYEGNIEEPIVLKKFILISYQIKSRSTGARKCAAEGLTCPFIVQENGALFKPKHIALFLNLATTVNPPGLRGSHSKVSFEKADPTSCKWAGYAEKEEDEVARCCFNVRGYGVGQYPVIRSLESLFEEMFRHALACSQLEFQKYADALQEVTRVAKVY
ncbi:hypothetical protein HETIRDRAFT_428433 [Heterobasidion irregulare TC 32-1]|uniref:Uncharacterized protein n=1 Tax=Heterobasidion irregulare (strain TC 32-1) TaxID=747525 RepID=W4K302_HETIT|nr:uncharacterized protein HETIRDRAFT_428433 [Heterobasidion irregulare TC 32-1]ETW80197.1 hypothetical protein HETIRDRAFT_428433 [Heterobasidion irregulare TC 32-1]